MRSRFVATAVWAPGVVTNADGIASVKFAAPDNLTAFRLMAVAADKGYRTARIPLACLADAPIAKLSLHADAPVALRLKSFRIVPEPGPSSCQGPF